MLGLKKGRVKLVAHDKNWVKVFERQKRILKKELGELLVGIEHIGSTSIPGIPAKPILDIDAGVKTIKDFNRCIVLLEKLGYKKVNNKSSPHMHLVFAKGSKLRGTTQYLHLIKHKGSIWKHDLFFRDYFRNHKKVAQQYAKLKKKLAKEFPNERMLYTQNKKSFVERFSKP